VESLPAGRARKDAEDLPSTRDASVWRDSPPPYAWRVYVYVLAALGVPFYLRGIAQLLTAPVDSSFLAALYVLLLFGNGCILELPPYRFLHLVSGLVTFSGFFIAGPAVLGLVALSIKPSELGLAWLRNRLDPGHDLPLGAKPAEYAVAAAAVGLTLGTVDLLHGPLGLVYPLRPADFAREIRFFTLLAGLYVTVIVLIEIGTWLRFGWQRAFGTRPVRADLVVYLLVMLLGVPIVSASVRAYGPWPAQGLFALGWMLWGFGFFVVAFILVRRRLEIERLITVIARQERLAALGSLASIIAHQTRHHLGVLHMSAYVLGETLSREPLSPAAREAVAHELDALARTRAELDKLLADELRGAGQTERFGLLELARECAADLGPLVADRSVSIAYRGEEREVRGDRLRLKQALTNLLRNAVEATPRGGQVSAELRGEEQDVTLVMADQGAGLSETARSHLFEPLFTEKAEGLGMGLYVARAIVEAHGGRVTLVNGERGTEASVRLPATP
jgi:signal transduction histidine kinase